jgi:nucleotide-binding universal stress UspA family protein
MSNTPIILVCLDTGNASESALRYACFKAKRGNFKVQILAVIDGSHKNLLFGSGAISSDKRKAVEKPIDKIIKKSFNEIGIMPIISIREGDVFSEIVKEVRSTENCIMIVFGKSYSSFSDNNVLPKIAQKIGRKIHIPITIVPESLDDEFFKKLT